MKESEAWLRVAESVEPNRLGLCDALLLIRWTDGSGITFYDMAGRLYKVFSPFDPFGYWWGPPPTNGTDTPRVLAALFLREIALDEEKASVKQR